MTDRAPVGMLCWCSDSEWPHRHVIKYIEGPPGSAWLETVREPAPAWPKLSLADHIATIPEWRSLPFDEARARLLKEIFG